ncbi:MAG TPA: enoyl-CoA hydratase, partial [Vicinamibacterales bacterium]|nr:enoyl-CoA hydratase [Vicinamibacterales bacterium]
MPSSNVAWDINESVASVTLDRPSARNALTWEMYDALVEACDTAEADPNVRVLIIRGSGGAFAAGTDISQFREFEDGDDGVAYERRLDAVIDRIERLSIATIAEIDGAAAGGGCAIAMACDLRICSDRARFGVPVARTLGNCLSITNTARMVDLIGPALTRDLLLTGRMIDAREAMDAGLITTMVDSDQLEQETFKIAAELSTRARSTIVATKAMMIRLRDHRRPP